MDELCGGYRIRTCEGISPQPHFECGALDHSAKPPSWHLDCMVFMKKIKGVPVWNALGKHESVVLSACKRGGSREVSWPAWKLVSPSAGFVRIGDNLLFGSKAKVAIAAMG